MAPRPRPPRRSLGMIHLRNRRRNGCLRLVPTIPGDVDDGLRFLPPVGLLLKVAIGTRHKPRIVVGWGKQLGIEAEHVPGRGTPQKTFETRDPQPANSVEIGARGPLHRDMDAAGSGNAPVQKARSARDRLQARYLRADIAIGYLAAGVPVCVVAV